MCDHRLHQVDMNFIGCPAYYVYCILLVLSVSACVKDDAILADPGTYILTTPAGFPEMFIPADNPLTQERIDLGRRLFYDPILSRDTSLSCATCHMQENGFGQQIALPIGIDGRTGLRNAPPLGNIGYHPYYLREGGVPTLEQQVAVPVQEFHEFNTSFPEIVSKLKNTTYYVTACRTAYNREPDAFCVTRALAAFQRTLITGNSAWDQHYYQGNPWAVNASVKNGWTVFQKIGCAACHTGFDFSDYQFYNIGLYAQYPDPGRFRLTGLDADVGSFKTPTLRNIAVTAPYMHDGSIQTLDEVLAHFESGGHPHPNKSPLVYSFTMPAKDRTDLILFLESLTDYTFLNEPALKNLSF